jgi:hypothetical protein
MMQKLDRADSRGAHDAMRAAGTKGALQLRSVATPKAPTCRKAVSSIAILCHPLHVDPQARR